MEFRIPKKGLRTVSPACLPAGGHWQPGRAVLDRIKECSMARRLLLLLVLRIARLLLAGDLTRHSSRNTTERTLGFNIIGWSVVVKYYNIVTRFLICRFFV